MGTACSPGTRGVVTGTWDCVSPPLGTHDAGYLFVDELDRLDVGICDVSRVGAADACGMAATLRLRVPSPTLGVHTIRPGGASASSATEASSGFIEIGGYDPVRGVVCGSFDLTFAGGSFNGTFDALAICP